MAKISELFDETLEPKLREWLLRFKDPVEALNHIGELFAELRDTVILGNVHESVSIKGPVHIGKGSTVHAHVCLDGPIIIGENVSIRSQAQIRNQAYLGSNCVVGHSADIKRSICLNGSKIQDGTFVGDSVLGMAARIGSGAILANRKFNQTRIKYKNDEGAVVDSGLEFFGAVIGQQSRIGANCVLSPGTLVGEHTWVGSGCVLHGRFGSDLLIQPPKQELVIAPKERSTLRSGDGEYKYI